MWSISALGREEVLPILTCIPDMLNSLELWQGNGTKETIQQMMADFSLRAATDTAAIVRIVNERVSSALDGFHASNGLACATKWVEFQWQACQGHPLQRRAALGLWLESACTGWTERHISHVSGFASFELAAAQMSFDEDQLKLVDSRASSFLLIMANMIYCRGGDSLIGAELDDADGNVPIDDLDLRLCKQV